jgi:transcriptional regulator
MTRPPLDLLQGTVDVLILKALCWQPQHGFALAKWIRERTEGVLHLDDAALYQGLHRLERKGWLSAEWGLSDNNRRAKYYRLTPIGRRQLRTELSTWRTYAAAVFRVLDAAGLET